MNDPLAGNRLSAAKFMGLQEQASEPRAMQIIQQPEPSRAAAENDHINRGRGCHRDDSRLCMRPMIG